MKQEQIVVKYVYNIVIQVDGYITKPYGKRGKQWLERLSKIVPKDIEKEKELKQTKI